MFLGDEEMAVITPAGVEFTDYSGRAVSKKSTRVSWDPVMAEKAGYKHFMLKEIFEQPWAVKETVLGRASVETGQVFLQEIEIPDEVLRDVERVVILACGTSWHSALVGKFMIESLARVPVEVDYGSEYRYRDPIVSKNTLAIVITQSGETADTLAALREAKKKGARSIAICNVVGSMATRETDGTVYTHAGPEIGVASTKAFTSQLVALHLLAIYLGQIRGTLTPDAARPHLEALTQLPLLLEQTLKCEPLTEEIAQALLPAQRLPLSRPRHQLPDRARGRAQAEGNLLHPRRGLSGRRDEARPDRAHRRADAGRHHRAARPRVREDDRQRAGGEGARRVGHRADDRDARRQTGSASCSTRRRIS